MLSLITFIVIAEIVCVSACVFPGAWQYTWWIQNDPTVAGRRLFRQYGSSALEKNMEQLGESALMDVDQYICTDTTMVDGTVYYVRHLEIDPSVEECVKGNTDQPDKATLLFLRHIATGSTGYTADECSRRTDFPDTVTVLVKFPFEFVARVCPFKAAVYAVALSTWTAAQSSCLNDKTSLATVTAHDITFNTCLQGNNYTAPFRMSTLQCAGNVRPKDIGAEDGGGDILIAYVPNYPDYNFYVIRYLINSATEAILMSIQGDTSGGLHVLTHKRFDSVSPLMGHQFQYSYLFRQATCDLFHMLCENGGTCETKKDVIDFTCLCSFGTYGRFCENGGTTTTTTTTTTSKAAIVSSSSSVGNVYGHISTSASSKPDTQLPTTLPPNVRYKPETIAENVRIQSSGNVSSGNGSNETVINVATREIRQSVSLVMVMTFVATIAMLVM